MMLRYSDQVKRLSLVTVSPARSVTRISQSAYARAKPTKSQASKRRYPSYDLERSETFICQLVNASLTHFSTTIFLDILGVLLIFHKRPGRPPDCLFTLSWLVTSGASSVSHSLLISAF